MTVNKNKSISKGFFSKNKFPVAITLSSSLFVHLLGCNAIQSKSEFIRTLSNNKSCKGSSISLNSYIRNEEIKSDPALSLNVKSKEFTFKPLCDLLRQMCQTLDARQKKMVAIEKNNILYSAYKSFYKEVYVLTERNIKALYKILKKASKDYQNQNIDNLYEVLNKATQNCKNKKLLERTDNFASITSKVQILALSAPEEDNTPRCTIFKRLIHDIETNINVFRLCPNNQDLKQKIHMYISLIDTLYKHENTLYKEIYGYTESSKYKSLRFVLDDLETEWNDML
ncbi:hypothetical protein [Candidatus Cardinium sp. cBcalN1]|nr:hypothetical protein [Candidatus Cardinium sp. cBcalN1]